MSFNARLRRFFGIESRETAAEEKPQPQSYRFSDFLPQVSGPDMGVATVYQCVRLLSESVASLPMLHCRRTQAGIWVESDNARMRHLMTVQPDGCCSAFDFWRELVTQLLLRGNAYVVPVYNPASMQLDRLGLCTVGSVRHDTLNDLYRVNDPVRGIFGEYSEDEIIHVKGMPGRDPKTGVGVITYARQSIEIAKAGDTETLNRFVNGGNVRGIVSNDTSVRGFGEYQDSELERTAENLDDRFRHGERIVSLPGQVDFKQISLSSTDMQFLESRKFSVLEICRFFGVHPSFVFSDTSTNYKSAEQANLAFLSHTLTPLLSNIECEFRRKLISPELCGKYTYRFDRRSLHACDLNGMADFRAKMLQTGATLNEVRLLGDLPPVEGGDVPMVSTSLSPFGGCEPPGGSGQLG